MVSDFDVNSEHDSPPSKWGILPTDVLILLKARYWQNRKKLKSLLSGEIEFPLKVFLKPPKGNAALQHILHFQEFVLSWKEFEKGNCEPEGSGCVVIWEHRIFRSLSEQEIPTHLIIADIGSLAGLLGCNEVRQLREWQSRIQYIFDALSSQLNQCIDDVIDSAQGPHHQYANTYDQSAKDFRETRDRELFLALITHLETLDNFNRSDLELLSKLIPQLHEGMGEGGYLRALPVTFVDTKFIENNLRIIESIVAALIDGAAKEIGLMRWLNCKNKPKDWLLVKPLCQQTKAALGSMPLLRLSSDILLDFVLPATNILVIENEQSCLVLNNIPNTIAVSGGGKNIAWLQAEWLAGKNVGYWGDIDSEGFSILSDARGKLSNITPLMMNAVTVEAFEARMVAEPESVTKDPVAMTDIELALFKKLRSNFYANKRLEQERLPIEHVMKNIESWIV